MKLSKNTPSVSPLKSKKTKKSKKPAVVNIKLDLRDIQMEDIIESYLNKTSTNKSVTPKKINNYETKSKSPNLKDCNFKDFIEKCTHVNDISTISTKETKDSNNFTSSKYGNKINNSIYTLQRFKW